MNALRNYRILYYTNAIAITRTAMADYFSLILFSQKVE